MELLNFIIDLAHEFPQTQPQLVSLKNVLDELIHKLAYWIHTDQSHPALSHRLACPAPQALEQWRHAPDKLNAAVEFGRFLRPNLPVAEADILDFILQFASALLATDFPPARIFESLNASLPQKEPFTPPFDDPPSDESKNGPMSQTLFISFLANIKSKGIDDRHAFILAMQAAADKLSAADPIAAAFSAPLIHALEQTASFESLRCAMLILNQSLARLAKTQPKAALAAATAALEQLCLNSKPNPGLIRFGACAPNPKARDQNQDPTGPYHQPAD